jgi:hypothetical protein
MAAALAVQNKNVSKEISNIMNCLTNENVKGNQDIQLDVWFQIFSRLLKVDGKRLLYSHSEMRFSVKQRAHDALDYPQHPIKELAKKINNFIEQIEYWNDIQLEDIIEEQL